MLQLERRDGLLALVENLRLWEERPVAAEKNVAEHEEQLAQLEDAPTHLPGVSSPVW